MEQNQQVLFEYVLQLADNSMILGQRNAEWCGHGPVLEQDIALTNITLDLIGEARSLYQYAAEIKGPGSTEDSIAFLRDEAEYRNLLLCEQPNTDWAHTIIRQFFYDAFHYFLQQELLAGDNERLREIAAKTIKEATYHLKWSSEWTIRLGDGTPLSQSKMQEALNNLWPYTGEMFMPSATEQAMFSNGSDNRLENIRGKWNQKIREVLEQATLNIPEDAYMHSGGKRGLHSEHMGYLLAEMQYLQRVHPHAEW